MEKSTDKTMEPTVSLRLREGLHTKDRATGVVRFGLSDRPGGDDETSINVRLGDDGRPDRVEIMRRAHSYFPVYLHALSSGALVIADTMGAMHDVVREQNLEVGSSAQLEHLLFGRPPEEGLVAGIDVVDHGQRVVLRWKDDQWEIAGRKRYDRFFHDAAGDWSDRLDEVSMRLEGAVAGLSPASVLFSGGVDSSLLRTLLDDDVEMVSGRVPGPDFAPEVEQAARAAALFDGEHRYVDVDHGEYLESLIELTRRTGLPCPAMQHVLQTRVAAAAVDPVCYGELGDGTFGLPLIGDPALRQWVHETELDAADAASRTFSLASMRDDDRSLDRTLEEAYGPVDAAYDRRARRARQLIDWSETLTGDDRRWERFVALGHAIDFLTVGCVKCVRDFASSEGIRVHTPYTDRELIDSFHRCDPATRYHDGRRAKPVLKALLADRLGAYPIGRPKLASGLPRTWYFTQGPLTEVFDRFPPPEPMAAAVDCATTSPRWENSWVLWPALSYAVWYHQWFDAESVPSRSDVVTYEVGHTAESPRIAS